MSRVGPSDGDSQATMIRRSGLALILGGACFAAFMLLHPYAELAGAHAAHSPRWVPAHSFHFLGALLTLFGLVGLHARQRPTTGRLERLGFVLAFVGTAMFVGTGMITAYVWPVIAEAAPTFVDADGPMFTNPLTAGAIDVTYAFLVVGYVLLGVATIRARLLPRWASLLVIVGIVMFSAPVEPVGPAPWIVRVLGAIVFGAGLAGLGRALRTTADEPEAGRLRPGAAA